MSGHHTSNQPLDRALAGYIEDEDANSVWYVRLSELVRMVGEERLAHAGQLAPAKPVGLSDGGYNRVKHLLYALTDHLPIGTILTLVGEATDAVALGGIVMDPKIEPLVAALAQQIEPQ